MVIFGDEDNMVERFVEIDARVFLEGTAHVASGFCWKTQKTRVFAAISLRSKVLKEALSLRGAAQNRQIVMASYKIWPTAPKPRKAPRWALKKVE